MKKRSLVYIVLAGILWGTSGIFVYFLSPMGFSSVHMACMRGCVAAVCMCGYAFFADAGLFRITLPELLLSLGSGASMFVTGFAYYGSIQASSVSTAVVLMYTAPAIVTAFSVMFLGERLSRLKLACLVIMICGCGLVSGIVGGVKFSFWGVTLGLLSGIAYSAYNIFTKIQMRKGFNPVSSAMYCFVVMAVLSLIFSKPQTMAVPIKENFPLSVALIIGIGVCTSVLPYFLYTLSLKSLPVSTASALSTVEPMAATIFSIAFLGESLSAQSAIGVCLIIGSVLLLSKSK